MKMNSKKRELSEDFHTQLIIPKKLKVLSIDKKAGNFIYNLIKKNKLKNTLEVGFGLGVSTAYIISATKSKHIVIDPFFKTAWNSSIGIKNIKKLGFSRFLTHYNDYSHNILPQLVKKGLKIDFAFIDGDHKYDSVFIDYYYIDLMLKKNGFILLDDAGMRTTQLVASFIRTNKKNYREVNTHYKNFLLFKKISTKDTRPWYHFNEFYNKRGMKSHSEFKKYDLRR